ncbi:hypothetical protein THAOC_28885, partial [Thalassiosira oceanica]
NEALCDRPARGAPSFENIASSLHSELAMAPYFHRDLCKHVKVSTQVSSRREHALKRNPPSVLTAFAIAVIVTARAVLKSTGECAKVAACLFACGGLEAIQTVEDIGSGVDVGRRALGAVHAHLPRRAILATSKGDGQFLHHRRGPTRPCRPRLSNSLRLFSGGDVD